MCECKDIALSQTKYCLITLNNTQVFFLFCKLSALKKLDGKLEVVFMPKFVFIVD